MRPDSNTLGINPKASETILIASLTVNFCVFWSFFLPQLCGVVLRGGSQCNGEEEESEHRPSQIPIFCRRFSTNLIFYVAMPVCGVILLTSTDVVNDPFFVFNATFRLVFSIALGHYTFKTAEVLFCRREVFHYKPLFVHHLVAGTLYAVILKYEQNAILGLVNLFLEGSLIFAELEQEQWHWSVFQENTKLTKIGTSVAFALAVVLKGVFPVTLVAIAFATSSQHLLEMSYVPLAFFFLGLVFFAAVDVWFFKDAFAEVSRQFSKQSSLPIIHLRIPTVPLTTAVNHDGLTKLLEINGGLNGAINITQNPLWNKDWNLTEDWSPVSLPFEPEVPVEMKATESLGSSQKQWTSC